MIWYFKSIFNFADYFNISLKILRFNYLFINNFSGVKPILPITSLENLHDIEELMDEGSVAKDITPDVQDKYFKFESPKKQVKQTEKDQNYFNFQSPSTKPGMN